MNSPMAGHRKNSMHERKGNSRTTHMSVSSCSIEVEQQGQSSKDAGANAVLCTDFKQLSNDRSQNEALVQCLQMYGYQSPNKLQQHAIPMVLRFLGRELGGSSGRLAAKGKSCMVI